MPDSEGYTPLYCAAENGHEGVVQQLLGQNVNPDTPDDVNRTPLSHAAENGHEGVVQLLLGDGMSIPMSQTIWTEPHYRMLPVMGTRM